MNELEFIDDYFSGRLSPAERMRFETSLEADNRLAESVAFYLSTREAAKRAAHDRRKAEFDALRQSAVPVRAFPTGFALAMAASVVLLLGLGGYWLFQQKTASPVELADQYVQAHYRQLSSTMGGPGDRLQTGIGYYNQGKFAEAGAVFDELLMAQPHNDRIQEYAGLSALRTGNYDRAIERFQELGKRTDLYANPGLFLEALARLKRNQTGDREQAKTLLKTVVAQNLQGKAEAEKLIEAF
ncbi:hypothetical protein ACFPMF_03565 [Larkinella bovis]|uniref:Tetratricopeptide repeat protein n=1 Tax=Larkinella bovis TaxID=683041 RepID=A0ABW0I4B1_9BACT